MGFWTVLVKDIRLELRTRESLASMVVFSVGIILLFTFAFNAAPVEFRAFTPGLMWMTYFFTAVLGLLRSFGREKELEAYALLLTAPIGRDQIYLGKMAAFSLFLLVTQVISLPLFGLFLNMPLWDAPGAHLLIVIVTDLAIAAVGTLIASLSIRSPASEILLPIVLFPLLTPILIAATHATDAVLDGRSLMLLITCSVLFVIVATFIFDYISEQ
jgi:heme exporter protein B